ncbi:ABC transporter, ATP-binding protein [hydrothermal vent metagenome]|uniref:ABC transporter, ATP-binding protein n=1 Tax=hydrothermal vent metagenome TaxID=652676 RepID=A0A1W1BW47_9ZZZZ
MKIKRLLIKDGSKELVDIAFEINSSLGLVGQSGSGKSLTLKALLGMLPNNLDVELKYDASFVLQAGKSVALVPQNPFTALSPLTKIKKQFFCSKEQMESLFDEVGLQKELLDRYPPELSGGQLQRVVIAMALENRPRLLLLDEPTTALDPKTTQMILDLLLKLQKEMGFLMLFVTHEILAAAKVCEDIFVIKDGHMVEYGKISTILKNPKESYTKELIEANFANRKFRE